MHTAGSTEVTSPVASTGAKRHAGVGRGEGPAGGIARSDMETRALPWQLHLQPPSQGPLAALGRQWSVRDGGHIPLLHRVWILISASNVRREALALAPCGAGRGSYSPHPTPPTPARPLPHQSGAGRRGGGRRLLQPCCSTNSSTDPLGQRESRLAFPERPAPWEAPRTALQRWLPTEAHRPLSSRGYACRDSLWSKALEFPKFRLCDWHWCAL